MRFAGGAILVTLLVAVAPAVVHDAPARASSGSPQQMVGLVQAAADATSSARRVPSPLRSITVAATGDVLPGGTVDDSAAAMAPPGRRYDFAPMFAPVAPILRAADLAICHMEIPIGTPVALAGIYGRSPYGGNLLLAPYEVAAGLGTTGFDRCSTSSNHSLDLGIDGIGTTLDALDAAGITHAGTARTPGESAVTTFDVKGIRIAHLAYTTALNTDATDPFRLNFTHQPEQVAADVSTARALGAQIVIVSIHLGAELLDGPTDKDRAFVTQLTALALVDLVIEHGPHVIQPLEQVNGTWVYWSVGNFVSSMGFAQTGRYADPRTSDGLIATARFVETTPGQFTVVPTPVLIHDEDLTRTVYPVISTLADPTISPELLAQLQLSLSRSSAVVPGLA